MMINQLEARYTLYSSAEEMLAPETLSDMLKRKVTTVRLEPMGADFSSNQLFRVWADEQSLVMKSLFPRRDWLAIGSQDTLCRSVTLWQYGILDRVQPHLQHAQLAACHDGDDFSILMEDVSRGVFPPFQYSPPAMPQLFRILDSLAEMHALFWQDDSLRNPILGLADIEVMQTLLSERYWEAIQDVAPHIFAMSKQGWNALFDMLEADSREIVQQVLNHPQAVVAKLASFPFTLRHGDFRLSNLAILPDTQQVVAFDWQQASYTPAAIDLMWLLMSGDFFTVWQEGAAYYRQQLAAKLGARFDPDAWQEMLEVACLVEVMTKGVFHALFAATSEDEGFRNHMKQSVATYSNLVRKAAKWL